MSKTLKYIIAAFIMVDLALLVCVLWQRVGSSADENAALQEESINAGQEAEKTVEVAETKEFVDNDLLYNYDMSEVDCIYVTVTEGSVSEGTNHSFDEVNSYMNAPGQEKTTQYLANALVQVGDETGPLEGELGYGKSAPNATINVRGKTSTSAPIKSYKLELFKDAGLWNGQRTIALNKHYNDRSKVRNALYYYLMRSVPDLISLRTYFVHLYICDQTSSGDGSGQFVDYGLYTAVEQPNNRFMKNHGLSNNGYLYKATHFEFYRYSDAIRLIDDPLYEEEAFSDVLEPKADTTDHSKLIEVTEAVNDYSVPIETVIEKYFDLDNVLNYLAFNELFVNPDSSSQNYYLYSPVNSSKWYFIAWDGDDMLTRGQNEYLGIAMSEWKGDWEKGLAMHSGNILFRRVMCNQQYREKLTQKIEEMHRQFTQEEVGSILAALDKVVDPYLRKSPDLENLGCTLEERDEIIRIMPEDIELGYQEYLESLDQPLPFYLGDVVREGENLHFNWDEAYDFDGEFVTYTLQVSADPAFPEDTLLYENEVFALSDQMELLPAGEYYFRVIATNASGYSRLAYDQLQRAIYYDGVRAFRVTGDGSVVMLE